MFAKFAAATLLHFFGFSSLFLSRMEKVLEQMQLKTFQVLSSIRGSY